MHLYSGSSEIDGALSGLNGTGVLSDIRPPSAAKFKGGRWPGPQDEEWRRSRVADFPLDQLQYSLAAPLPMPGSPTMPDFVRAGENILVEGDPPVADFEALSALIRVQAANDQALPELGVRLSPAAQKAGLAIYDLLGETTMPGNLRATAKSMVDAILAKSDNRFLAWNLALHSPAFFIYIPKNYDSKAPIVLDLAFAGEDRVHFPLVLVLAESGSRATLVQRLSGAVGGLVNHLYAASIGANSQIDCHALVELDESAVYIGHDLSDIARDTSLRQVTAVLGSGFAKIRSTANLNGSGAEAYLDGIYFARDEQHIDIKSVQNHQTPQATSRAYYKGVVRDKAHSIYQGMIHVAPHAPKTDAYLTNKNMVLNDGARSDSIPCLEIKTDDVKCSHGSTTGTLPAEQLFYLESRGFSRLDAESALIIGYLDEVIDRLPEGLRWPIRQSVTKAVHAPPAT